MNTAPVAAEATSKCSDASVILLGTGNLEVAGSEPFAELPSRVNDWRELINRKSYEHGVPPCLVAGVIGTESGGDPDAVSYAGATGLMQLMPQYFGGNQQALFDPETNVDKGTAHLAKLLRRTNGNLVHTLASYNAGSVRCGTAKNCPANRWNVIVNCGHGGDYVTQVLGRWNAARQHGYALVASKPAARATRNWSWLAFAGGALVGAAIGGLRGKPWQ